MSSFIKKEAKDTLLPHVWWNMLSADKKKKLATKYLKKDAKISTDEIEFIHSKYFKP